MAVELLVLPSQTAPNAVMLRSVARGTTAVDAEIVAAVGAATALATVRLSGPASASLVYAVPAELFHACAVSTSAPFGKLVVSMVAEAVVESGDTVAVATRVGPLKISTFLKAVPASCNVVLLP